MKIFLIILLLSTFEGKAETLIQVRNRVNTWLTNHVGGANGLVSKQNAYAASHGGKFWQGLITFTAIPNHTASTAADAPADRLTAHPTDQTNSWHDLFPAWDSETFPAAAKIDVYDGPSGKGWFLTVFVRYDGVTYARRKWWGPVTNDYDWRVFDPLTE